MSSCRSGSFPCESGRQMALLRRCVCVCALSHCMHRRTHTHTHPHTHTHTHRHALPFSPFLSACLGRTRERTCSRFGFRSFSAACMSYTPGTRNMLSSAHTDTQTHTHTHTHRHTQTHNANRQAGGMGMVYMSVRERSKTVGYSTNQGAMKRQNVGRGWQCGSVLRILLSASVARFRRRMCTSYRRSNASV